MSTSPNLQAALKQNQAPAFHWLNPFKPTTFRVIVGLGLGALVLLLINTFSSEALTVAAYVCALVTAVLSYVLAEVLLVALVALGPFIGFVFGVIAYFTH
jgi:hypothetical protein